MPRSLRKRAVEPSKTRRLREGNATAKKIGDLGAVQHMHGCIAQ